MAIAQVGSAHPKYFAATDIFIGDMSNTAYEFLLFNRPIILLANAWLREHYADIGIKTDLDGLEAAVKRSLENPAEFQEQREQWLKKTIYMPDGRSSARCIDLILEKANIPRPKFVFIHGGDPVRKTNLSPMVNEVIKRGLECKFVVSQRKGSGQDDTIYVAAHVVDLNISGGYKVHFNHDPRGKGSTNLDWEKRYYKKNDYFPLINLHVTAGEVGDYRTKITLGPMADRTAIGGYPKADDFLRVNTEENKKSVYKELGLEPGKPLVTYAPAARVSDFKPGGSLSDEAIATLKDIAKRNDLNLLFKFKYQKGIIFVHALHRLRRMLAI